LIAKPGTVITMIPECFPQGGVRLEEVLLEEALPQGFTDSPNVQRFA
jgi:hypothetical protein